MRIILVTLLAGTLLACSQGIGGNAPDDSLPAQSLARDTSVSFAAVPVRGETSLEERIANYPTVVRARMTSESIEVVAGAGRLQGKYFAAVKFDLTVSEYLNGTGANKIRAIWVGDDFDNHQKAEGALPDIRASRDTQWDNREAVFFLKDVPLDLIPTLQGDNHYFLASGFSYEDNYSLSSEYSKLWLPAAAEDTGATGQSGTVGDSQDFLLAMPTAPVGATGASGASAPAGTTITLGDLKQLLSAVNAEMDAGDGSAEYKDCVRLKHQYEREDRYLIAEGKGRRVFRMYPAHEFDSGQPAGTTIYEDQVAGAESDEERSKLWFDGRDADLFNVVTGDLVPVRSAFTFTQTVVSARPIPAGEYRANNNFLRFPFIPCNHVFTYEMAVTVTAPEGAVHEAFFDPAVIGAAVGADSSNGILKPASFAVEGVGTTNIKRLQWESGRVEMQMDPPGRLAGHHIDFIALDGSVVLRLDFDDAREVAEEGGTRALTWGVCEQPWSDGDLLMLRISESPPDLTGATNDDLCPPPAPQNLTASSTQDSVTLTPLPPKTKRELFERIRAVIAHGWHDLPSSYGGTGAPGMFLEDLLGLTAGALDIPDAVGWELFHKEADGPDAIMRYMVRKYGWKDKLGRLSFRHTIRGKSDRFRVDDSGRQLVVRPLLGNGPVPYWSHEELTAAAGAKLRRLMMEGGRVRFYQADAFEVFNLVDFVFEVLRGEIVIDFDCREAKPGSDGLRNHGTKFRISPSAVCRLYMRKERL